MTSWIPEGLRDWASNKYTSWTSQEEWNKTYNSWTSKEEWDKWYTGSRLESCAQSAKVAGEFAWLYTTTLLETPAQIAGDMISAAIPTAQKASKVFKHFASKAHEHFFTSSKEQDSWIIAWFKSIGRGVSQFFASVWTFITSPFMFHP